MPDPSPARVLIVANRTAATPALLDAIRARADRSPCRFTLLVPQLAAEEMFGEEEARKTLELAIPLLEEVVDGRVEGIVGPHDALLAIERTLVHEHFDEVIISTLPERVSHWLKRDLPARVERLGIPVTVVTAKTARRPLHAPMMFGGP
ncbi:MAG TPA: hypothetical protein VN213_03965 [Solirubrobacteraceae bacterium]|nr:hypothetical protein [Solirubrobacteraceae bacterium]